MRWRAVFLLIVCLAAAVSCQSDDDESTVQELEMKSAAQPSSFDFSSSQTETLVVFGVLGLIFSVPLALSVFFMCCGDSFSSASSESKVSDDLFSTHLPTASIAGVNTHLRFVPTREFKDAMWAVLFILQFVPLVAISVVARSNTDDEVSYLPSGMQDLENNFWVICTGAVCVSIALATLAVVITLAVIRHHARRLIMVTCITMIVSTFALACVMFWQSQLHPLQSTSLIIAGVLLLIVGLLQLFFFYSIQDRIPFAAAMLEIVAVFVRKHPSTLLISLSSIVLQIGWILVWFRCLLYFFHFQFSSVSFSMFALFISLFWTNQVIKNSVHVTVAGAFGSFYFSPQQVSPTISAMKRAITTFGSICFGSFIVAVIQATKQILHNLRSSDNSFLAACGECLLQCIENIVQYISTYAFTYCALYGQSFCEASHSTFQLFASSGFEAAVNDDLTGTVFSFVLLLTGVVCGGSTYILALLYGSSSVATVWLIFGFVIGLMCVASAMEVLHSSIAALFVCFAEDPAPLSWNHPELFNKLATAWSRRYGDEAQLLPVGV